MSNGIPSLCEFIKLCKCFTFPILNISVSCESEMKRIDNGEQLEFLAIFVNIFFLHLCQNIYLYLFQHIYLEFYLCQHLYLRPHCLVSRQDRRARRVESNNRERRRMHELNHAFQVRIFFWIRIFRPGFFWVQLCR